MPDLLQQLLDKNYAIPRQQRKNELQIDIYAVSYFVLQKVTSTNDVEFVISGMHAEYGGTYEIKFYYFLMAAKNFYSLFLGKSSTSTCKSLFWVIVEHGHIILQQHHQERIY